MLTLIENGQVYAPASRGVLSVLLVDSKIGKVGAVDRRAVEALGVPFEVIDATGLVVAPGFIDGHEHCLGGSGEDGFSTQTPEINFSEIVSAGITTVVGCLGVDTRMKTLFGLLAKAKAYVEEGISALMYTGGYNVPPTTIMGSCRDDILFVSEVIGLGEVAISDRRSMKPTRDELAKLVTNAAVGGMLTGKAGVTHFHVGDASSRLEPLRELLDHAEIDPCWLYPTHVNRNEPLIAQAIELTRRGCFVDFDTSSEDLRPSLETWLVDGGDEDHLTVSSDAGRSSPRTLRDQLAKAKGVLPLERLLALVTRNPARALRLEKKGELEPGKDADLLVLDPGTLEARDVIARGVRLVKDGKVVKRDRFLEESNRRIVLHGAKA